MVTPLQWFLLILGGALAVAYAFWWYRSHEEPVAGRLWAATARAGVLFLACAILINPAWTFETGTGGTREAVLLDASYSMSRPLAADRGTLWSAALEGVRAGEEIWVFGGEVARRVEFDSLPAEPVIGESRLTPAITAAAAAGVRRVRIVSDGGLTDGSEAREAARRAGLEISISSLRPEYPQVGIAGVEHPDWVEVGDSVRVEVELVARDMPIDSIGIEIMGPDGDVRAAVRAEAPEAERFTRVELGFPITGEGGVRRYTVRIADPGPDLEDRDDRRPFYLRVAERPTAPVAISLRPDWEPSFLLPNLDRITDAPARAYLRLDGGFVSVGDDFRAIPRAEVVREANEAPLLVLHGYGADVPAWARRLARDARRLLVLPAGDDRGFELPGWDVRVGSAAAGEWYVAEQMPSSPLALELGGISTDRLPPLRRVRGIDGDVAWGALVLQRSRRGTGVPAVAVGHSGDRRWAVAAAEGYWRWAFRSEDGRGLYRSLWTGLAGWLIEGVGERGYTGEPLDRVARRGELLRWVTPEGADSLAVRLAASDGDEVWRGTGTGGDTLAGRLPPGRYTYRSDVFGPAGRLGGSSGAVEVESFAEELLPGRGAPLPELEATPGDGPVTTRDPTTRGLATRPWPYLLLILFLCVEWGVRRYVGLR